MNPVAGRRWCPTTRTDDLCPLVRPSTRLCNRAPPLRRRAHPPPRPEDGDNRAPYPTAPRAPKFPYVQIYYIDECLQEKISIFITRFLHYYELEAVDALAFRGLE